MSFGNRELKRAADLMLERMMAGVPEPEDCHYEETPEFRARMEPLFAKARRIERMQKARRAVASIVLALFTLAGTWLAVDTEARAAFFQWVREVYEDSVIYRYFNEPELGELPLYTISPLPEGYSEINVLEANTFRTHLFTDGENIIAFHYYRNHAGTLHGYTSGDNHEKVFVNGKPAEFYHGTATDEDNELILVDEELGLTFQVSSQMDRDTMVDMAHDIQLSGE